MASEWLTKLQNAAQNIEYIAYSLNVKADSFREMGQDFMADYLYRQVERLSEIAQWIREAQHEVNNEMFHTAQEQTGMILKSLLSNREDSAES